MIVPLPVSLWWLSLANQAATAMIALLFFSVALIDLYRDVKEYKRERNPRRKEMREKDAKECLRLLFIVTLFFALGYIYSLLVMIVVGIFFYAFSFVKQTFCT